MRNFLRLLLLPLSILLLGATPLFAWAGELPPLSEADKKANYQGVQGLTHHKTRVYGMFFNADQRYYHRGETADFQDFLDRLAALENAAVKELRLEPGICEYRRLGDKGPAFEAEWLLSESHTKAGPVLRVTLWLDGQVDLKKLDLPDGIKVHAPRTAA